MFAPDLFNIWKKVLFNFLCVSDGIIRKLMRSPAKYRIIWQFEFKIERSDDWGRVII